MKKGDFSLCPYKSHRGLLIECNYCDALCKRDRCQYFRTLEDAKEHYHRKKQEALSFLTEKFEEIQRKIKKGKKV